MADRRGRGPRGTGRLGNRSRRQSLYRRAHQRSGAAHLRAAAGGHGDPGGRRPRGVRFRPRGAPPAYPPRPDGCHALLSLDYDPGDGLLTTISDGDGNVTSIERDGSGHPTAIVGPFGQRTSLGLDANGFLASVENPASERNDFFYNALGLLTRMTDPRSHAYDFTYDAEGRLTRDDDPAGGFKTLGRTAGTNSFAVTVTSGLGRSTS